MAQTLLDLAVLSGSDQNIELAKASIIEKPFLAQMPWVATVGDTFTTSSGTVPSISAGGINQGYTATNGVFTPKQFKVANYPAMSQVDCRIADRDARGAGAYRNDEDALVHEAVLNAFSSDMFYANQNTNSNEFYGLSRYMNAYNGDNIVNGTGSTTDVQTSIYFVKWGVKGVSGIYSNESGIMPTVQDMGKQLVDAPDGNGQMWAYVTNFNWNVGLKVNEAGIGRVANIENSGDITLANLQRVKRFIKNGADAIFCTRAGASYLDALSTNSLQTMVLDSELKVEVESFAGLPIFVDDSISDTEAVISSV